MQATSRPPLQVHAPENHKNAPALISMITTAGATVTKTHRATAEATTTRKMVLVTPDRATQAATMDLATETIVKLPPSKTKRRNSNCNASNPKLSQK